MARFFETSSFHHIFTNFKNEWVYSSFKINTDFLIREPKNNIFSQEPYMPPAFPNNVFSSSHRFLETSTFLITFCVCVKRVTFCNCLCSSSCYLISTILTVGEVCINSIKFQLLRKSVNCWYSYVIDLPSLLHFRKRWHSPSQKFRKIYFLPQFC